MIDRHAVLGFQTQYFPPDAISNAMLYGLLVGHLANTLARVDLITAEPHYGEGAREAQVSPVAGVNVIRCRPPSWRFRRFLPLRFLSELAFSARNTVAALRASRDWDVVLSSTPPLLLGLGALIVARLRNIPLIWWVQDLHPEIATVLGLTSRRSAGFRMLHRIHEKVLRGSSAIIAISDTQRQTLLNAYPSVCPERVLVLENPATHAAAENLGDPPSEEPIVFSYTGNLGLSQGLEHVLDVAAAVRDLPVRFVLHGSGAAEMGLKELARQRRLHNVQFSGFTGSTSYLDLLRQTHVLLLVLRPGVDLYSFPSKLWTYFAAGRPIAAWTGSEGAVQRTLERSGAGVFAPWGDVPAAVDALREMLHPGKRQDYAAAARKFYLTHPTPEEHARELATIIEAARQISAG